MKPHWDKIMDEINVPGSSTLVADVDCTGAGKPLCDQNGVQGFPTVKYGDPNALEDYQGGREYADLIKFAKELKPACSPSNLDLCDDDAKKEIEVLMALSEDELKSQIAEKEEAIKAAEKEFEDALEKLQANYKAISSKKDDAISEIKDSGLSMLKAVLAAAPASKAEL
jgi:hypothetical protein